MTVRPWLGLILAVVSTGCHTARIPAGSVPPTRTAVLEHRVLPPRETRAVAAEVREVADLINRRRAAMGCEPLIWDDRLAAVARRHSQAMARRGFFSHVDRDGNDPFERLRDAGIGFRAAAENIAAGQASGQEVYEGWVRSRGHRANLENCVYTHHGIGFHQNRWTHVFARF